MLVRSYRTLSPLPPDDNHQEAVYFLLHLPSGCPGLPLTTSVLYGVRTFLDDGLHSITDDPACRNPGVPPIPPPRLPGRLNREPSFYPIPQAHTNVIYRCPDTHFSWVHQEGARLN